MDSNTLMIQYGDEIRMGNMGTPLDKIPAGNWIVKVSDMYGFYLKRMSQFSMPEKVYGDVESFSDKMLQSFNSWDGNLGVLLSGFKGTGKSLLAKRACMKCVEQDIPVLMLAQPFGGTEFISFLDGIRQPCAIFIDEFEKIYLSDGHNEQHKLLSILDGTGNSNFLFVLTINDVNKMSEFFLNRPGRIHYKKDFKGMENEMIEEVALDILDDKGRVEDVIRISNYVGDISMDIVVSIVKELNEYPEQTVDGIMTEMNLSKSSTSYSLTIKKDGVIYATTWGGMSPYDSTIDLDWSHYDIKNLPKGQEGSKRTLSFATNPSENRVEMAERIRREASPNTDMDEIIEMPITALEFRREEARISKNKKGHIVMTYVEEMSTHEGVRPVEWEVTFEKRNHYHTNWNAF